MIILLFVGASLALETASSHAAGGGFLRCLGDSVGLQEEHAFKQKEPIALQFTQDRKAAEGKDHK